MTDRVRAYPRLRIAAGASLALCLSGAAGNVALGNASETRPMARSSKNAGPTTTQSRPQIQKPSITMMPPGSTFTMRNDPGLPISPAKSGIKQPVVSLPKAQNPKAPVVYLSFDDGPDPTWTPQILALLAKYDAQATFFLVGTAISAHPELAQSIDNAGHRIGNHSATHADLSRLTAAEVRAEIRGGVPTARCLRPPYGAGAHSAIVQREARAAGQSITLWTVDPQDWRQPPATEIARRVLSKTTSKSVVLLHDGGGNRAHTVAALAAVLPELSRRGYQFAGLPGC